MDDPIFKTPPTRKLSVGGAACEKSHAALRAMFLEAGFRMDGDNILPPSRVTEYTIWVLFEQWDV